MREDFLFTEKYRPKTVAECILPKDIKATFQAFVDKKNLPNFLLTGNPGIGKTTIAKAMVEEIGSDWIVINGSLDNGIDVLRSRIADFASTVSFSGGRKYVIIDEADNMNPNSLQPALRAFMETFSNNCGFILTCNYPHKLIAPIAESRLCVVDFNFDKKKLPALAVDFLARAVDILKKEGIKIDPKTGEQSIAQLILEYAPDWRRILNELQLYSATGTIDSGILSRADESAILDLLDKMRDKNFTAVRQWVAEQSLDTKTMFRKLYDKASSQFKAAYIPALVVTLARYQYQSAFAADQEINTAACFAEIMVDAEWR